MKTVFWIKTVKKIYQWIFSGACAWEVQRSCDWRKASPLPHHHWDHFIQKVKSLGETLTNGPFFHHACQSLWQISICLVLSSKKTLCLSFLFTLCRVFLVLSNFRHVYLGFRTTRKEIFWLGSAENYGRKIDLWHRTGIKDFKSELSWKTRQVP